MAMFKNSRALGLKISVIAAMGMAGVVFPVVNTADAAYTSSNYCGNGTTYYGAGPAYKLTYKTSVPGNPSLGINQWKVYHVWANAYYEWYYLGTEYHAC